MSSIVTSRTVASLPANQRRPGSQRPIVRVEPGPAAQRLGPRPVEAGRRGRRAAVERRPARCPCANHMNPYGDSVSEYGRSRHRREAVLPEHLDGHGAGEVAQVELDLLGRGGRGWRRTATASRRPHLRVGWRTNASTWAFSGSRNSIVPRPRTPVALAQGDQLAHPRQQRRRVGGLGLHVDDLVVVALLGDQRQVQPVRVGGARSRRCGRPSTASACARRCGRRGRRCRPSRSRRRSR